MNDDQELFTGLVPESLQQRQQWASTLADIPIAAAANQVQERRFERPPTHIKIEWQGATNSCAGHAGSTAFENCVFFATGQPTQLSRWYTYIQGQKRCGLYGRDQGCKLGGVLAALRADGVCREETCPFPGRYDTRISQSAVSEAAMWKVTNAINVESGYDRWRYVLGQNIGAVVFACRWPLSLAENYIANAYLPRGQSGHALAAVALSTRTDRQGRPYLWAPNSHGPQSGLQGWLLVSPDFVDAVCGDGWGAFGITDMAIPQPRQVDWSRVEFA